MSLYEEVLDELEAGELSVEFEGQEPQALLEWALDRFSPRIAISTAFQIDGSVLIDMAYELGGNGLLGFPRFLTAVRYGQWSVAEQELKASLLYRQVPRQPSLPSHRPRACTATRTSGAIWQPS